MKKSIFLILIGVFLLQTTACLSQNFIFSQYRALPYLLNPATTGHLPQSYTHRVAAVYRNHWNLPAPDYGGLHGFAAGWDRRYCGSSPDNTTFGIGTFAQYDDAFNGGIRNAHVRGLGSVSHKLGGGVWLAAGLAAGVINYGLEASRLTFDRQYDQETGIFDPELDSGEGFFRENQFGFNADVGLRLFSQAVRGSKETRGWEAAEWSVGFSIHDFLHPRYYFLQPGKDRTPNRLDPGFSAQGDLLILNGHLMLNAFYWRQSFSGSRQCQFMFGAAKVFGLKKENQLLGGVQLRIAGREYGLGGSATRNALTFLGEWRFGTGTARLSWDFGLSRIGNRPPNGFELSIAHFLGDGACLDCPDF